jgi:cytochrome c
LIWINGSVRRLVYFPFKRRCCGAPPKNIVMKINGDQRMKPLCTPVSKFSALLFCTAFAFSAAAIAAPDEEAAKELARQNNCFKCHAIKKDKDGPAWSKVAEKYKGKANAEERLITHITSGEMAKFPDGHEEKHKVVETDPPKDMKQIKNLIDWILSL